MKKSILFIADKPNWAYHNIAKTWQNYLEGWDCFVAFANDFAMDFREFSPLRKSVLNLKNKIQNKEVYRKIDAHGNFSVPTYKKIPVYHIETGKRTDKTHFDIIVELAHYFQYISKFPFTAEKKLVGLYTDSFPHEGPFLDKLNTRNVRDLSRPDFFEIYLKNYDGLIVGNTNLLEDYQKFTDKIVFANGIYRQNEFAENKNVGENEGLKIGWTGNPTRPMKGFNEVIIPAVEEVQKTGRKVTLKTQFSGSYESILHFYKDVDLVVIASEADTGPSLFAEASLSKVPAISTKIGFPKMIIEDGINGMIVNRDIEEMKNAIIKLYDNRNLLKSFSDRIKKDYLKQLDNSISFENLKKLFT